MVAVVEFRMVPGEVAEPHLLCVVKHLGHGPHGIETIEVSGTVVIFRYWPQSFVVFINKLLGRLLFREGKFNHTQHYQKGKRNQELV